MSIFADIVGRFRSVLVARGEAGRRVGGLASACMVLIVACTAAQAAESLPWKPKAAANDPRAKMSALLRDALADPATTTMGVGKRLGAVTRSTGQDDTVGVVLDAPVTDANLAAITATGATVTSTSPRWNVITVEATAAQLDAIARLPGVTSVSLPHKAFHRAQPGTVINEAGAVIQADALTTASNITGVGQVVGIISDSINLTTTVGAGTTTGSTAPFTLTGLLPQNRGDLPASIQVVEFGDNSPGNSATDEGEAMMEECFKLAPGARFAFGSCNKAGAPPNQTNMADTIRDLASKSQCTIIADDIGFPDEPMFQDGPISQAANTFVQGGGIYLSAFGNDGDNGILTTFSDVSTNPDPHTPNVAPSGNDFHNWGGVTSAGLLPIDVTGSGTITIVLQWNEPYQRFALGAGATSDYDLYLYSDTALTPSGADIVAFSNDAQGVPGQPKDPLEIIEHTFTTTGTHHVFLAVDRFSGSAANTLRIIVSCNAPFTFLNTVTGSRAATGFGHPTANGVLGIAATRFTTPTVPESFTSKGGYDTAGIPFFFDTAGGALFELRNKPDVTAPDGVSTSNSNFSPFFGTSAAVPNAAAAAALTWSANPILTNAQIKSRMTTTVKAMSGGTALVGLGLVQAQRSAGVPVTNITASPSTGLIESGNIDITVTFAAPVAVTGSPQLLLNTTPARSATFLSGSGTTSLVFRYTLISGDASTHLDLASSTPVAFNGGTITALIAGITPPFVTGDPIMLLLPTPGAASSLGANTTIDIDTSGPGATIVGNPATKITSDLTFDVTFAQAVTGLGTGSFTVINGTVTSVTGSGASYVAHVTATAPGTVTLSIAANTVFDAGSLGNHAASGTATFDIVAPTLVITPTLNSVITTSSVAVTFTFSEAVTGFTAGDITIINGTAGALTGSGAVYHMPVTSGSPGPLTITVLGGTVTDLAGNASATSATATVTVTEVPASTVHGCGLGSMFASVFGLGLLALMAWARGRDGAAKR
ncbi:MAG: S8 family serine peptidase [Planctomycetes bacterium]|nr:S8 family serine peptidase [Planctomycetota bacterium]